MAASSSSGDARRCRNSGFSRSRIFTSARRSAGCRPSGAASAATSSSACSRRAIARAIELAAHAILIPGDLFDVEGVDAETLAFALRVFDVPGCPPVFIAPGNHDPYVSASPYWSPRLLARARLVVARSRPRVQQPGLDARNRSRATRSRCGDAASRPARRPSSARSRPQALAGLGEMDSQCVHVALFHGSREQHCPPGQKLTAPFSDAELQAAPFTYLAAGHYHVPSALIEDVRGVRLAYAGSPIALECGRDRRARRARGARHRERPRVLASRSTPVQLDPRRVHARRGRRHGARERGPGRPPRRDRDRRCRASTSATSSSCGSSGDLPRGVRYTQPGPELTARVCAAAPRRARHAPGLRPRRVSAAASRPRPRTASCARCSTASTTRAIPSSARRIERRALLRARRVPPARGGAGLRGARGVKLLRLRADGFGPLRGETTCSTPTGSRSSSTRTSAASRACCTRSRPRSTASTPTAATSAGC